jgi:hypothetical protein
VVAVGTAGSYVFGSENKGVGTNIGGRALETAVSGNRSIDDIARLDPRVNITEQSEGSISVSGQNNRYNNISVDGLSVGDPFGLQAGGLAFIGSPISADSISAYDIKISDFDTTSDSVGANINAVTKSGTNEFHGSVYGTMRDGEWFGNNPVGAKFNGFDKEQTYGFTLGGPLVKDRVFFFANYEKFISDNHRANFRYSNLEQNKLRVQGMGTGSISLSSYWYTHQKSVESYVGQLFSDWTENFSTEFKVSYRDYKALRVTDSTAPSIRIFFGGTEAAPSGDSIYLGTEANTHGNSLMTETWDAYASGTLTLGDHDVKFGANYSDNKIYNYFGANSWGTYVFYGLDNFASGKWSSYNLSSETSPGSIAVNYNSKNLGLFVQDTWYVNSNLTLTMGLRADKSTASPSPQYNAPASTYFGYNNSEVFGGGFLIQPRLGFNYAFNNEKQMQLRGGIGLFQGEAPQVWIGNSFNTTGFNYTSYSFNSYNPLFPFNPDGLNQTVPAGGGSSGAQNVNFVGNDFELPSIWKANLGFDTETGWMDTVFSAEVSLTKVNNGLYYNSLNIGKVNAPGQDPSPEFIGQDGREIFYNPSKRGAWASADNALRSQ